MSDITGRDGYIIWQALTYFITAIDSLPEHEREFSNQDDMRAIRDAIFPEGATSLDRQRDAQNIRRKFGLPPVSETV